MGRERSKLIRELSPVFEPSQLLELQKTVEKVQASETLIEYLQDLLAQTRLLGPGISPRAGLGWLRASRAWALIHKRHFVLPEDLQAVAVAVLNHRLEDPENPFASQGPRRVQEVLESVPVRV